MRRKKYANLCICKGKRNPKQNMPADGSGAGPLRGSPHRIRSLPKTSSVKWLENSSNWRRSVCAKKRSVCAGISEREKESQRYSAVVRASCCPRSVWVIFWAFFLARSVFYLLVCSSYVLFLISAAATALHIVKGLKTCDLFRRRTPPTPPP